MAMILLHVMDIVILLWGYGIYEICFEKDQYEKVFYTATSLDL